MTTLALIYTFVCLECNCLWDTGMLILIKLGGGAMI